MSQHAWSERELERRAQHRPAVPEHADEVTGNVAATCRYFGSAGRYSTGGGAATRMKASRNLGIALEEFHRSPNATEIDVVGKIVYLRQTYHFGPGKIAMYLKRYHDLTMSKSGVWRILKRLGMNRLPSSQRYKTHKQRWKRYEKQRPGHHV